MRPISLSRLATRACTISPAPPRHASTPLRLPVPLALRAFLLPCAAYARVPPLTLMLHRHEGVALLRLFSPPPRQIVARSAISNLLLASSKGHSTCTGFLLALFHHLKLVTLRKCCSCACSSRLAWDAAMPVRAKTHRCFFFNAACWSLLVLVFVWRNFLLVEEQARFRLLFLLGKDSIGCGFALRLHIGDAWYLVRRVWTALIIDKQHAALTTRRSNSTPK